MYASVGWRLVCASPSAHPLDSSLSLLFHYHRGRGGGGANKNNFGKCVCQGRNYVTTGSLFVASHHCEVCVQHDVITVEIKSELCRKNVAPESLVR